MNINLAVFGGGSVNWCPWLLRDIYMIDGLEGGEVRLLDPDPVGLQAVAGLQDVYNKETGKSFRFCIADDLSELLDGVDFVLATYSPGSLEAYHHDLEIPTAYGIRQPVSMTSGPTGIFPALRAAPVGFELAEAMTRYCPDAWLLNVTNPMSYVTHAMNLGNPSGKVVGLCHEFHGQIGMVTDILDVPYDPATQRATDFARNELNVKVGGINHFIWLKEISRNGEDLYPKLREYAKTHDTWYPDGDPAKRKQNDPWGNNKEAKLELLRHFGYLPLAGDRHLVEFFGNMCNSQNQYALAYGIVKTQMRDRERNKRNNLAKTQRIAAGEEKITWKRSAEQAGDIIEAVVKNEPTCCIANLPNKGQISNVQRDYAVETMCTVTKEGFEAEQFGDLPGAIGPLVRHHIEVQKLAVEAALEGSRQKAIEAMTLDLTAQLCDMRQIPKMIDAWMNENKQWLPRFFAS